MSHSKTDRAIFLSTAYLPNIQYISKLLLQAEIKIDIYETYLKQSYRNRCVIYGANGVMNLSIPVIKPNGNRTKTKDILIENDTNWMQVHWRAIVSAYNSSPFFEIFEAELAHIFKKKEKFLIDFNSKALDQIFNSLGVTPKYKFTEEYSHTPEQVYDFRQSIHPKKRMHKPDPQFVNLEYYQVFNAKFGFQPNLSFIDLMFNEGPQAIDVCLESVAEI